MFDSDNSDIRLQVYPLQKDGQFTQEDADINRKLVNPLIYPWLYNLEKDNESCLELSGERSQLIDANIITPPSNTGHNTAWEGDGNPEAHNIRASFAEHGYKLHYPPLALFQDDRISNGNIILIDRRTTHSILVGGYINEKNVGDSYNYQKVIADTFKVKDGNNPKTGKPWTVEEIEDELSVFGQSVNYKGQDPKGRINQNSFVKDFVRIYQNYLKSGKYSHLFDRDVDTKGETVFVPKIDVILKRLNRVMGNSGSASTEREKLAYRIRNNFYPEGSVRSLDKPKGEHWLISGGNNYKTIKPTYDDKDRVVKKGLKYLVVGSSQYRSAATKAAELWNVDRDYFIRVVIQTETLTGNSYSETYWKRLKTFREYWFSNLNLLSDTYFGSEGPFKRNVELYGAIPAYGKIHNNAGPLVILTNDTPEYDSRQIDEDDDINLVNAESTIWIQKTKKISTEIKND